MQINGVISMPASPVRELYVSPNGDRWLLGKDHTGELLVCHYPNNASGGRPSEVALEVFLSQSGRGPEYLALEDALSKLGLPGKSPNSSLPKPHQDLEQALGKAVAHCWSGLTPEVQHELFEAAVLSEGETIRQQLAIYLHGKHARTVRRYRVRQYHSRIAWAVSRSNECSDIKN
jgi:hypothetical protein